MLMPIKGFTELTVSAGVEAEDAALVGPAVPVAHADQQTVAAAPVQTLQLVPQLPGLRPSCPAIVLQLVPSLDRPPVLLAARPDGAGGVPPLRVVLARVVPVPGLRGPVPHPRLHASVTQASLASLTPKLPNWPSGLNVMVRTLCLQMMFSDKANQIKILQRFSKI